MTQANSLIMFHQVASNSVSVERHQDGNTAICMFTSDCTDSLLIISLRKVSRGYYSLAYHLITSGDETSQDFSLPFPAYSAPVFMAEIINDVFQVAA